jgi:rsbT co-antagonist protein RsbR
MPNDRIPEKLFEVSDADSELRRRLADLQPDDLGRIAAIRDRVSHDVEAHVAAFFDYLARMPEAKALFAHQAAVEEARRLKREHLLAMVGGVYGKSYVEQRVVLGALYARHALDLRAFLGAFNAMMGSINAAVVKGSDKAATMAAQFASLNKVAYFDLGIIIDVLVSDRERTILEQQEAIRELSTPTLQVRDRLLILPIIGVIDSHRARQLTDGLLQAIRAHRAKVAVLDVTGVATIDSKVANHLIQTVSASRLMGATVIITGLSAEVAQSLVTLGVELSKLNAVGDLQGGLEEAERMLGYETLRIDQSAKTAPLPAESRGRGDRR